MDDLGHTANLCHESWNACGHGLKERHGKAFGLRGHGEEVSRGEETGDVVALAPESDVGSDTQAGSEVFEVLTDGSISYDPEMEGGNPRKGQRNCFDQCREVLDDSQTSDEQDGEAGLWRTVRSGQFFDRSSTVVDAYDAIPTGEGSAV